MSIPPLPDVCVCVCVCVCVFVCLCVCVYVMSNLLYLFEQELCVEQLVNARAGLDTLHTRNAHKTEPINKLQASFPINSPFDLFLPFVCMQKGDHARD